MKLSRSVLALLVPMALVAAACGDDEVDPAGADDPVPSADGVDDRSDDADDGSVDPDDRSGDDVDDGFAPETVDGSWLLTSGHLDGVPIEPVAGWDVTMTIDGDTIGGTAACNGYGGTVTVGDEFELGGSFAVGELSWTEMGCDPAVMALEQQFLQALQAVDSYELAGTLSLGRTGVGTSLIFEPLAPVPTADIVGTTWVLDTVIEGDAAWNAPGMDAATLTLHPDGTLDGSTGCRQLEGEWVIAGAEIVFTTFAAIDDPTAGQCAPDAERLDGFIVTVLGDGFTAEVDGQRLTVMSQGAEGLSYTATR